MNFSSKTLTIVLMLSVLMVGLAASPGAANTYVESPMLAERVAAGELPPVDERLPEFPFVVGQGTLLPEESLDWQPGQHGGTLTGAHHQPNWNAEMHLGLVEPLLSSPGIGAGEIEPNLLEVYIVNDDNTVFTFRLREGLRWSDGHPVTTEDIRFTYEDVLNNEELTSVFPMNYRSPSGEPMELEVIDDYTFRVSFDEPYGGFINVLTTKHWSTYTTLLKPAHYLKDFHIDYTSLEDMRPYLDEEELENEWWQLFGAMDAADPGQMQLDYAVGFPVLTSWMRVESPSGMIVMERNPYYHKVDTEGNQLPYIDTFRSYETTDIETMNMRVIAGEVDFLVDNASMNYMPLYRENEERGGYRAIPLTMHRTSGTFFLNDSYDDPVWQEVTGDIRFRQAVNYAIDNQEIIDSVYFGFAEESAWIPGGYEPEQANELLDDMGLDERDSDGYRIGPDGETFRISIEMAPHRPDLVAVSELVTAHLQEVGLNTEMRQISIELQGQRATANELQATVLWVHSTTWERGLWDDYLPFPYWAPDWQLWYNTEGASGSEPPENVQELYAIHERIVATIPETESNDEAWQALKDWYYENLPFFLTVGPIQDPVIVSDDLRNVPETGITNELNLSIEQLFFVQ